MPENYKQRYEQMKQMVDLYQDEIVPRMREQIARLEENQVKVRCGECKYASSLPEKYIGMYEEITLHCVLCRGDNGDSFDLSAVTPDQFCDEGERSEGE